MVTAKWLDNDLADAYAIRRAVFIEEQNVPEAEEIDGSDGGAKSLVVYDGGKPVATGRLMVVDGIAVLGRIAVLRDERGKGFGDFVTRLLIRRAYETGYTRQAVHAQLQAVGFYERLGFVHDGGGVYLDAGIEHIDMFREGDIGGKC